MVKNSVVENVIIFGVDMSSSVHVDNQWKDILILGKGLTQGLDDTTLTADDQYSINFSRSNRKFCLKVVSATAIGANCRLICTFLYRWLDFKYD